MVIADKKKKENISEYIIHMYQTEDLLRVYNFNMKDIQKYVISHIKDADTQELYDWYEEIARQMKEEGIEERGHLQSTQEVVNQLNKLHEQLLKADQQYRQVYSKSAIYIHKSIEQSNGAVKEPVQACLNGIYGYLLLRMDGQKLDESLMSAVHAFGDLLSYLSFRWRQQNS
ncbi:DUF4924 family protein [Nafulsella turpanensis]|uniref:DUF4924 family protein n=1 Tax=Nafulsella turpanensis TaxID=1265690 RepID=UPI0003475E7C|nr:DUF4924 family protein [Nafulsella turpanensis]